MVATRRAHVMPPFSLLKASRSLFAREGSLFWCLGNSDAKRLNCPREGREYCCL